MPQKSVPFVAMVKHKVNQEGKREVVEQLRHRFLQAGRVEKSKILSEFVALSGIHRKSAIPALCQGYGGGRERRGWKGVRVYTGAVVAALVDDWRACGGICGKRPQPFLPEVAPTLKQHGGLQLDEETRHLIL